MKAFDKSMSRYLAKSTRVRDHPMTYVSRRTFSDKISDAWSTMTGKVKQPFRKTKIGLQTYERVDLSRVNAEETFVIAGKPPSKFKRFSPPTSHHIHASVYSNTRYILSGIINRLITEDLIYEHSVNSFFLSNYLCPM